MGSESEAVVCVPLDSEVGVGIGYCEEEEEGEEEEALVAYDFDRADAGEARSCLYRVRGMNPDEVDATGCIARRSMLAWDMYFVWNSNGNK